MAGSRLYLLELQALVSLTSAISTLVSKSRTFS
jgi:hypothetical protein